MFLTHLHPLFSGVRILQTSFLGVVIFESMKDAFLSVPSIQSRFCICQHPEHMFFFFLQEVPELSFFSAQIVSFSHGILLGPSESLLRELADTLRRETPSENLRKELQRKTQLLLCNLQCQHNFAYNSINCVLWPFYCARST